MSAMLVPGGAALAAEPVAGKNAPAPGIAAKVLELTGAETRIVWLRREQWENYKDGPDGGVAFSIVFSAMAMRCGQGATRLRTSKRVGG